MSCDLLYYDVVFGLDYIVSQYIICNIYGYMVIREKGEVIRVSLVIRAMVLWLSMVTSYGYMYDAHLKFPWKSPLRQRLCMK